MEYEDLWSWLEKRRKPEPEKQQININTPAATSIPATDLYIVNAIWVER